MEQTGTKIALQFCWTTHKQGSWCDQLYLFITDMLHQHILANIFNHLWVV
jgi:hypothetical protein